MPCVSAMARLVGGSKEGKAPKLTLPPLTGLPARPGLDEGDCESMDDDDEPFANGRRLWADELIVKWSNDGGFRPNRYVGTVAPLAIDFRRSYADSDNPPPRGSDPDTAGTSELVPTDELDGATSRAATNDGIRPSLADRQAREREDDSR